MLLARNTTAITTAFLGMMFYQIGALAQQDAPPPSCPVTLPSSEGALSPSSPPTSKAGISVDDKVAAYGTDQLWTMLPTDGTWRGVVPQNPRDYAYSNKLPWGGTFSFKDGPLTVTGKRLDGPAPSFTEIEPISWEHAFMGFVNIPLFGCWEITGEYRDQGKKDAAA